MNPDLRILSAFLSLVDNYRIKMRFGCSAKIKSTLALALVFICHAHAESAADIAWAALVNPSSSSVAPNLLIQSGSIPAGVAQEIAQLQQTSTNAQAFCSQFAADSRVPQARKISAMTALQAASLGGDPTSALALAAAYRKDPTNAVNDRIDVGMTADVLTLPLNGQRLIDSGPTYAKMVDNLHAEFGEQPRIYNLYLGVMQMTDLRTSVATAQEVLSMNAPDWAKKTAQQVLARHAMIGKPIKIVLSTINGQSLDLGVSVGVPTAIIVWSNQAGTGDLAALTQLKSAIIPGTRIVYLSLQSDLTKTGTAMAQAPLPGTFCFEQDGLAGLTAQSLGLQQLPCVYVLKRDGTLSGFGRLEDLPVLVATAFD
jgi:hypothetical protein